MKIETLKKDNKKKWILGSLVLITLIVTISFLGSRAKFKTTGRISIAKGTIKYNYDIELIAVKLQNDKGTYDSSDNIPTSGYILNTEKSICKAGDVKQDTTITYENGKINILGFSKKGTKCEIYFDVKKTPFGEAILANNTIDTSRSTGPFNELYNENTAGKIFSAEDDDGTTYFFAGSNPNNWAQFGKNKEGQNLYWRIIRINGDGSIRLIYNGTTTDQAGETTQIGTSKFSHKDAYWNSETDNAYTNDNAYVGYMYGTAGSSTYEGTHANINSSEIKNVLDTWYEENLKTDYSSYLDSNAGFCGDRSLASETGIGTQRTYYVPYNRVNNTFTPTYKCPNQVNDLYTINGSAKGNKALTNPIGLITVDEAYYAGSYKYISGTTYTYWLTTGQFYWTMSPLNLNTGFTRIFRIVPVGGIYWCSASDAITGVRPVINLKADVLTIGSGTVGSPYKII